MISTNLKLFSNILAQNHGSDGLSCGWHCSLTYPTPSHWIQLVFTFLLVTPFIKKIQVQANRCLMLCMMYQTSQVKKGETADVPTPPHYQPLANCFAQWVNSYISVFSHAPTTNDIQQCAPTKLDQGKFLCTAISSMGILLHFSILKLPTFYIFLCKKKLVG